MKNNGDNLILGCEEMNDKYPYIGKSTVTDRVVLFVSDSAGFTIEGGDMGFKPYWDEGSFTNITKKYLSNTKIKVLSEEHSEMIQKLAFSVGYGWRGLGLTIRADCKYLFIYGGCDLNKPSDGIYFNAHPHIEIFLPMPELKVEAEEEKPEEKPLWSIGDECILSGNLMSAEVIGIYEGIAWVKIEDEAITVPISHISKPKSTEELIKEELIEYVEDVSAPAHIIVNRILKRFNVTEK